MQRQLESELRYSRLPQAISLDKDLKAATEKRLETRDRDSAHPWGLAISGLNALQSSWAGSWLTNRADTEASVDEQLWECSR